MNKHIRFIKWLLATTGALELVSNEPNEQCYYITSYADRVQYDADFLIHKRGLFCFEKIVKGSKIRTPYVAVVAELAEGNGLPKKEIA